MAPTKASFFPELLKIQSLVGSTGSPNSCGWFKPEVARRG